MFNQYGDATWVRVAVPPLDTIAPIVTLSF
jgi:hypothetical protein